MSRIGKKSIKISQNVKLAFLDKKLEVSGPLGLIALDLFDFIKIENDGFFLYLSLKGNVFLDKEKNSKFGLFRSLLNNAITGVEHGFAIDLELEGIGYRVQLQDNNLIFSLGYSHPVLFNCPNGIVFEVEGQNKLKIKGIDKELVGRTASQVKSLRKKDAYKAKGIHFSGSIRKKKPGKSVKK
jgi:large subunit ribosomal protein L6